MLINNNTFVEKLLTCMMGISHFYRCVFTHNTVFGGYDSQCLSTNLVFSFVIRSPIVEKDIKGALLLV